MTSVDVRSGHTLGVALGRHFGTANFEMDANILLKACLSLFNYICQNSIVLTPPAPEPAYHCVYMLVPRAVLNINGFLNNFDLVQQCLHCISTRKRAENHLAFWQTSVIEVCLIQHTIFG